MKVLIAAPFAGMNVVYETDLEIIQTHLDRGDEVVVLGCDGDLPACFPNLVHDLATCIHCASRRRSGLKLLNGRVDARSLLRLHPEDREEIARLPKSFVDLDSLRAFTLDNFDLGWGALSSLVSATRDPDPDPRVHDDAIRRLIISAASVYRSVQHHIDELKPDLVYVFNGRFAVTRAVFRAAQSRGVDCYTQERGATFRHYALYKNRLIHDPNYYQELVREFWRDANQEEARIMGAAYFIEVSQGINQASRSFVGAQNTSELPAGWDQTKNNVVVFTSSDDEFVGIGDLWNNRLYADQYDGLTRIIEGLRGDRTLHLYVRLHPNQAGMRNTAIVKRLLALDEPNVTVVAPSSSVSTYALMRAATRVLTFGSTTGIEAVYWGKPSILGGVSHYDKLGAAYTPGTHDELIELLRRPNLPALSKEAALMFGYFARSYGLRFRYFQPHGLPGGPFRGVMVRPSPAARIAARLVPRRLARVHLKLIENRLVS
jgi:hypothetical protein